MAVRKISHTNNNAPRMININNQSPCPTSPPTRSSFVSTPPLPLPQFVPPLPQHRPFLSPNTFLLRLNTARSSHPTGSSFVSRPTLPLTQQVPPPLSQHRPTPHQTHSSFVSTPPLPLTQHVPPFSQHRPFLSTNAFLLCLNIAPSSHTTRSSFLSTPPLPLTQHVPPSLQQRPPSPTWNSLFPWKFIVSVPLTR